MKIVSLSPSFTEILEKLGAAERLVGVTDHCPEVSPVKIGSPKALNVSEILALRPDLVLADQNENRPEEIRELQKEFGVKIFDVRSIPAVVDAVWTIGRLVGEEKEAHKLTDEIQEAVSGVPNKTVIASPAVGGAWQPLAEIASLPPAPPRNDEAVGLRTLTLLWNQPYLTINFDTYISRLIEAAGGRNVFHEDPVREFPIEMEDMIEKNPELLLLPGDPYPFRKRHVEGFRKYRVFSKIRIERLDGKLFSRFGPRTVTALETLRSFFQGVAHVA